MSGSLLQVHERPGIIAGAQTVPGRLALWIAGCALLAWHHIGAPMLVAFTLVLLFPQRRRLLLALAAAGLVVLRFLPRDEIAISHLARTVAAVTPGRWLEFAGSAIAAGAAILLLIQAAIHFERLPQSVRRHPLLLLHVIAVAALVAGVRFGVEVLVLAPFLLWRASYLLKSAMAGRTAGTTWQDHLFYLVPVFGGSNTPYGKGLEYLGRCEARTPEAAARSQLAGVRLLLLAAVLSVLLDFMLAFVHGQAHTRSFHGSLARYALAIPTMEELLSGPDNPGAATGWLVLYLELVRATTQLAIFGHLIIGSLRLLGFNAFRNTYKPLYAASLVEFWNRFYYYFKELLVEMFFYPAFYRAGWAKERWRILIAIFAAAFAGNAYFHLLRDHEDVLAGNWPAVVTYWVPRLTYCFFLALGIWLSMLRQQRLRKQPGRTVGPLARLRAVAGVWTYFGFLHTWLVAPPVADAARRLDFFRSLVGF